MTGLSNRIVSNGGWKNFSQTPESPHGVGPSGRLFVNVEDMVDTSNFDRLHQEVVESFATMPQEYFQWTKFAGELVQEEYLGTFVEDDFLVKGLYDKEEESKLISMDVQTRRKYLYFKYGTLKPWAFSVYLRQGHFDMKTNLHSADWTDAIEYFPLLKGFLEGLPFDSIGRIMFFCTDAFRDVPTHRDQLPVDHRDHNINFFFDGGRKSFVYDPQTDEKHYLEPGCRAYFFNNRDLHGVDAESRFRYTLRVDGTFNREMREFVGLFDDGRVMTSPIEMEYV